MEKIPVRLCAKNEMRAKVTIRKGILDLLEERYFREKYNEKKKKMYPKLLGTEMAPQQIVQGNEETSRLERTETFSLPPKAFVGKNTATGMNVPHKSGKRSE